MATPPRRSGAFIGPATARRKPRKRTAHDLCEGCGHFRSEHRSGKTCHRDECLCQEMGWTIPTPVARSKPRTVITDEVRLQMKSLLQTGMNYREVAAALGCSKEAVRNHCPGYGENGQANIEVQREIFKYHQNLRIQRQQLIKERKS